nr:hypothetical protein Iba_chr14bCG9270 [Ipomoea batatas]
MLRILKWGSTGWDDVASCCCPASENSPKNDLRFSPLLCLFACRNGKESRNLLTLAQGIGATPWPVEESDDEVDEAELQAALEASKKADNVVSFSVSSSSGTVSLPVSVSPSLVSSLPSAVVCSDMPSSSCVTSVAASICALNKVLLMLILNPNELGLGKPYYLQKLRDIDSLWMR